MGRMNPKSHMGCTGGPRAARVRCSGRCRGSPSSRPAARPASTWRPAAVSPRGSASSGGDKSSVRVRGGRGAVRVRACRCLSGRPRNR